jgi:hypothetical protein
MCFVEMASGPKNRDFGLSPAMIVFTFVVTKSIGDQCWRQLSLALFYLGFITINKC